MTSTLRSSRKVIARLHGVPPNMSVRINTPCPGSPRAIACAISSRASAVSSCQPIDTAANRGTSPTMVSVALTSSVASCPCVTTTTPIIGSTVPVLDAHGDAFDAAQRLLQLFREHDGAMTSARTPDGHGQIALPFLHVLRQREPEK